MNEINVVSVIFQLFGGLGLFLLGMQFMSEGLQKSSGESLKKILEKLTTNRLIGTGVGAIVTAIIQSSSATTVMVVGFVNAGLMNLTQALSVILGANIGTTITGQIISFKISGVALPCIGLGAILYIFFRKPVLQYIGQIIMGFGLLFLGMDTMTDAFKPLAKSEEFKSIFVYFSHNPIAAVIAGALTTLVVQSSSATIGITIALATAGIIDFPAAAALVLGENIGTTITANLAALNASRPAKQAAFGHFLFNLIGVSYMLVFFVPFMNLVDFMTDGDVAYAVYIAVAYHVEHLFDIYLCRCEQHLAQLFLSVQFRIYFVEVKTRRPPMQALPQESVTPGKQRRVAKAAARYLATCRNGRVRDMECLFDIIAVTLAEDGMKVEYCRQAYYPVFV